MQLPSSGRVHRKVHTIFKPVGFVSPLKLCTLGENTKLFLVSDSRKISKLIVDSSGTKELLLKAVFSVYMFRLRGSLLKLKVPTAWLALTQRVTHTARR